MLPSARILLLSQSNQISGNIARRSFASSILAEMSKMQGAASSNTNGTMNEEMEEHARLFLSQCSLEENEDAITGNMAYSLSQATTAAPKKRSMLPLTEIMRSQLLHAAAIGRYLHSDNHVNNVNMNVNANVNAINNENSVLEHTLEEKEALQEANCTLYNKIASSDVMPQTLSEALQTSPHQARVITETSVPFRITHVNSVWEDLCGYSSEESTGCTLKLLQGPETDPSSITALMNRLYDGEEAGCILVNYKKGGERFLNRLRVAPLKDHQTGEVTHFIGVLQEVVQHNS